MLRPGSRIVRRHLKQKAIAMNREQRHQEHHRLEREAKQAHERQAEERFSRPGPTIRPLWFLVVGIVLTLVVITVWVAL
jgi:hypothetical protein